MVQAADIEFLKGLGARYVGAVQARAGDIKFAELGQELTRWLDSDQGQLAELLDRASRPVRFEVRGPRAPSEAGWALLRAPWELLAAPDGGLLAGDALARFCVARCLGRPAAKPEPGSFRLGLAFMASSPQGQQELDFEAEEAAIMSAVGESRIDLLVEDSGDPEQLARRLAELGGMPVVHLSCHGLNNWQRLPGGPREPMLAMEDELGALRPVTAGDLAGLLSAEVRLVFVSACLTATGADARGVLPAGDGHKGAGGSAGGGLVAHSLATALVSAGVPAVIGWDGSVSDRAATVFAERLYQELADQADVTRAVSEARRTLLDSDDPVVRDDWHLARLWLAPGGGGPVAGGSRKRSLVTATHGTKTFLDRKHQVPVATAEMFVGRRLELQQALRGLRSGRKAGVLLHGQGRMGKSSLAARIADRCPDYAVAVVFGDYGALAIVDAVAEAVRTNPAARQLIEDGLARVRDQPESVEGLLIDLLSGPCAQAGAGGRKPLLLVIDDLEQILVADPAGPHRVAPELMPVLARVFRAFDPAETDSRLLVTSRFTFTLGGTETRLEPIQMPPLSEVAQAKLQRRQQALTPARQLAERAGLARRALAVNRGNPGLQDLIGLRLVYGQHVSAERAEGAVAGMEAYLSQGDLPADTDVRAFLENLAIDTLLQQAGEPAIELLRAVTLFSVPVPAAVIEVLGGASRGLADRLRGLGLLEGYQDSHDPARLALAANPLAAGRLAPLTTSEQAAHAALSLAPLFEAWGGTQPQPRRAPALDLQLTRLALLTENPSVAVACATDAVASLRSGLAADAFTLGRDAIDLLDRHGLPIPLQLLRETAGAALTSGDGQTGGTLLDRAARQVEAAGNSGTRLEAAAVAFDQAGHLITRGELDQAEALLVRARDLFTTAGDTRSAAVTWGQIADIARQRGDYDEAADLQRKQLAVHRKLGDIDGIAAADWGLALIDLAREDYESALPRMTEAFQILSQLRRPDGIAVVGSELGRRLMASGQSDEARSVLGSARDAATMIGQTELAQQISDLLDS